MIVRYNLLLIPLLLVFFLIIEKPSGSLAQSKDFGGIFTGELHFNKSKNWEFIVKNEFRMFDKFTNVEKFTSKFDVEYIMLDNHCVLGVGSYLITDFSDVKQLVDLLYRINLNITFQKEFNQLTGSYRLRYQNTFSDFPSDTIAQIESYFRQELKFEYGLKEAPILFFASAELFFLLRKKDSGLESMRTKIGLDYSISPNNILRFYIRNDRKLPPFKPYDIYYLGFSFLRNFNFQ